MVGLQNNGEESRRAKKALTEGEERFRLLVQGLRDYAIFMLDPKGRIVSWNTGPEHIEGYREEEILGQHFSVFYAQDDVEQGHPEKELRVAVTESRCEEEDTRVRKRRLQVLGKRRCHALERQGRRATSEDWPQ